MRPGRNYLVPIIRSVDFIGSLIFLGKPKNIDVKSILVLQLGNFGDVLVTLPTLKGFKQLFPNAKLDVLVKDGMADALGYSKEYVDRVIGVEEDWMPTDGKVSFKPLFEFMKTALYKELKSNKYDLIVDVHGDPRNNLLMYFLRGKYRVGFGIRGGKFFLTHKAKFDRDAHIIDRYFETVRCFSTIDLPTDLGLPKHERKSKKICLHPGTGLDIKLWSEDYWAIVADKFISQGYSVVLTGMKEEEQMLQRILSTMEYSNLARIKIIQNIHSLVLELLSCDLFVSIDTGPAHLAHFMGVPQIQLFGPSMAKRWGYENVCSVECECMNELECKYGFENRCMKKLKPEVVIKKAEEVLNGP